MLAVLQALLGDRVSVIAIAERLLLSLVGEQATFIYPLAILTVPNPVQGRFKGHNLSTDHVP